MQSPMRCGRPWVAMTTLTGSSWVWRPARHGGAAASPKPASGRASTASSRTDHRALQWHQPPGPAPTPTPTPTPTPGPHRAHDRRPACDDSAGVCRLMVPNEESIRSWNEAAARLVNTYVLSAEYLT